MASFPVFFLRRLRAGKLPPEQPRHKRGTLDVFRKAKGNRTSRTRWTAWRLEGGKGLNAKPWPFWVNVLPLYRGLKLHAIPGTLSRSASCLSSGNLMRLWSLALQAKKIPHRLAAAGSGQGVFVPALAVDLALHEMQAVERENNVSPLVAQTENWLFPGAASLGHPHVLSASIILALVLLALHALRWHVLWAGTGIALPSPPFPATAGEWSQAFGLDPFRTLHRMEWWRCVTALWIHGSLAHLVSNMAFGGLFMAVLTRRTGWGAAFALALLGGALGNAFNAFIKPPQTLSIGFSTAVFALIGASSVYSCLDIVRQTLSRAVGSNFRPHFEGIMALARPVVGPLMAGLAFLALLGGAGSHGVDYGAHIMGLVAGGVGAVFFHCGERRVLELLPRRGADSFWALLALALFAGAWACALGVV